MLREIAATLRTFALVRTTLPVAVAFAMLLGGTLVAGCGIKGALKPPPAATPSATEAAKKSALPPAAAPAPADADAPAKPKP
jgi:hypothetical protein